MDRFSFLSNLFFSFSNLLIFLSFLRLVSASAVTTPVSCLLDQRLALLQLKEGFVNSSLFSWQPGTDCCHGWEGVSCDETTGHVTTLDLSSYNIEGNLNVAIFNLTSLQHLNLAYNNFSGNHIPCGFERLTQLTYLNLSSSSFTGQIPIGIANLTKLISLDLSYNGDCNGDNNCDYLRLHKPNLRTLISKLSNLRELHLDYVVISENGTEWWGALSASVSLLQVLTTSNCNLSGPFDPFFSRLHSLTEIDLSANNFQSSVPNYFSDFPLKYVDLSGSNLQGSFPHKIFQIPTLIALDISGNEDLLVTLPNFLLGSPLESMVLDSTNLLSPIPYSIGNLLNLSYLDLSSSNLSEQIPQSLFALPNLVSLDLSNNKLFGQFSLEEFSVTFSSLTSLDLSYNQLTGSIPRAMYKLSNLESLFLSGNQLGGPIPNSIFGLSSLQYLDLEGNNLNGTVKLSLLQQLPNLTHLYLSHNQLSIEDDSDEQLSSLFPRISFFGLASCNLSRIPHLLRYQDSLIYVDLSKNQLRGVIPTWIWEKFSSDGRYFNMSNNRYSSIENISVCHVLLVCWPFNFIDFSFNKLSGEIPLIGAQVLDYSNNEFSEIPSNYSLYLNITIYLLLSSNKLSGEIPTSIFEAPKLQVLDLSHNSLSGLIPSNIFDALALKILILGENKFQGIVPHQIENRKRCNLLVLDLSNNNLDGVLPRSLTSCTDLMSLNIENNRFADTFPFWLGKIPNLQVLIIKSNQFYGTLDPPNLASNKLFFQKLRLVDLASNNFHGRLAPSLFRILYCMVNLSLYEIGAEEFVDRITTVYDDYGISIINKGIQMIYQTISASLMVEIDLSNNKFSGDIPETIGNLSALTALNLSHNEFTGSIPYSVKGLNHIESLDLSWNNLSGDIPQELTSLDSLSKLNISFNHLVGRIPQSPHFSTFDNSSFEGNPGLCGVPLSNLCEATSPTKNSTFPSKSIAKNMKTIVFLCLFVGLGFGTGFAIAILYPVIKRAKTRSTTR